MITSTGRHVYPLVEGGAPSLFDIGTGLSRMPRFAGQTRVWYPVLAHVLVVAAIMPNEIAVYGMLHDAAESIVGDQVTTWKNNGTRRDEALVMSRICEEHDIQWPFPEDVQAEVDHADLAALRAEATLLHHYDPTHPNFETAPYDADAYTRTSDLIHSELPWTQYGVGGRLYEDSMAIALHAAGLREAPDFVVPSEAV